MDFFVLIIQNYQQLNTNTNTVIYIYIRFIFHLYRVVLEIYYLICVIALPQKVYIQR